MSPRGYAIRVQGHLSAEWSDWFEGLTIDCHPDGTTTLSGPVTDQAALYGLLLRARDLGLTLIAVTPIALPPDDGPADGADVPS